MNETGRAEPAGGDAGVFAALWKLFSSMKTAITLLLLLALASVFGTFRGGPEIYGSAWYTALLGLIFVNLLVCSINRFGVAWRRTFAPRVLTTAKQAGAMQRSEGFVSTQTPVEAAASTVTALRLGSYNVMMAEEGGSVSIYAARGRVAVWGPYLTHLSIMVIFLGAIVGAKLGFEGMTIIPEGDRVDYYYAGAMDRQQRLGFEIELHSFRVLYDKHGRPSAYKSSLEVFDEGRSVARKVIDVNHPLTYRGVSFFQASYGPILKVTITEAGGGTGSALFWLEPVEADGAMDYQLSSMEPHGIKIGDREIGVFIHDFAPNFTGVPVKRMDVLPPDPAAQVYLNQRYPEDMSISNWKSAGWIRSGETTRFEQYAVAVDAIEYSKLDVSRNPGLPILYAGFVLILVGIFASFYVNHRVLRASIAPADAGTSVVVGATSRGDPAVFDKDFERIGALVRQD